MLYFLGRVRFHYGHPDVFDRIFHITRGGISKASCGINLSEDIFAGMCFLKYLWVLPICALEGIELILFFFRFQLNSKAWKCHPS